MRIIKKSAAIVNPLFPYEGEFRYKLDQGWQFRLDPTDIGLKENWQTKDCTILEPIDVPGTWQGQGFGHDGKETHKEFGLDIRAFKATYAGVGWYRKTFVIPEELQGDRLWLNFGGVAPTCTVWLNGVQLGENHEPLVPFAFEITDLVHSGENTLTLRVSEEDRDLCLTYYYCGKWSGIYRDVELTATGKSLFDQVSILPDADCKKFVIHCRTADAAETAVVRLKVYAPDADAPAVYEAKVQKDSATLEIRPDTPVLWSPENPALYRFEVLLICDGVIQDGQCHRAGLVKLEGKNKQFLINGKPYYMRGCGDFGEMPETVSPNTDREHWRKCLKVLRDYGYLYVRCQTFVPVPEYFDIADEVGLLVQSEAGIIGPICGHSYYHTYNQWPKPTPDFREKLRSQWNHLVERDVNHPSANLYCMSNELDRSGSILYLNLAQRCYDETKAIKPTAMVIWTDGNVDEDMPGDFINAAASVTDKTDKPVIQHEFRWWSSFPDISMIPKYKGLPERPFAELIAMEEAAKQGISHILPKAAKNSQKLQYLEAKCKLESLRRDYPTLAGVCHFNAADTGLSKQGIVDMFYERKCTDADQWQMTNGDTVILSSLTFNDRCYEADDVFRCKMYVSDYAHPAFEDPELSWEITDGAHILGQGTLEYSHEAYTTCHAGEIHFRIPEVKKPESVYLRATLSENGRCVKNEWRLWFFPVRTALPAGVGTKPGTGLRTVLTDRIDASLISFIREGGNAILKANGEGYVRPFLPLLELTVGRYFFTRPANFPPFEELQDGTIIQDHPMLGDFPHEGYADTQFYNMIGESPAIDLAPLGLTEDDPVIRMIHSYYVSRPLGYLVERRLGKGRLILCSMDLDSGRVEADYLRKQLCLYTLSENKADCVEISAESLEKIVSADKASFYLCENKA